jgi:serine/threonine-protein kinase HipA
LFFNRQCRHAPKNFALLTTGEKEIMLSPAYDMLSTRIAMPADKKEMALTIYGKKRKLKKAHFDKLAGSLNIPVKSIENIYIKFSKRLEGALAFVDISFLPRKVRAQYKTILKENAGRLDIG